MFADCEKSKFSPVTVPASLSARTWEALNVRGQNELACMHEIERFPQSRCAKQMGPCDDMRKKANASHWRSLLRHSPSRSLYYASIFLRNNSFHNVVTPLKRRVDHPSTVFPLHYHYSASPARPGAIKIIPRQAPAPGAPVPRWTRVYRKA